jgi:hypothetical protein
MAVLGISTSKIAIGAIAIIAGIVVILRGNFARYVIGALFSSGVSSP